jgi:predicted  nucleic acid-binding Zn-ribbon protein
MTNKSYNRGSNAIKQQIDAEVKQSNFNKADEIRAGRMIDRMNAEMARLESENMRLNVELEKARNAYDRRVAELMVLKDDLRDSERLGVHLTETCSSLTQSLMDSRKGHAKLTAVMKTALTPEQYHSAREVAATIYPELFSKPI